MFDVGFLELVVILVLGLLVLGPERLPKAAQKAGYWFGKARRYVEGMKSQVEAEFDTSEVKRLLHNQEVQIRELQSKITDTEGALNAELQNQFDDDDPGESHHEALEANSKSHENMAGNVPENVSENVHGPQYDIIEEDDGGWGGESDYVSTESKSPDQAKHDQVENEPVENNTAENHSAKSDVSEKV